MQVITIQILTEGGNKIYNFGKEMFRIHYDSIVSQAFNLLKGFLFVYE
jgi:hypothetical protein